MKELRLGHSCLAGNTEPLLVEGLYITKNHDGSHWVVSKKTGNVSCFRMAKLDPSGQPINGDEVEIDIRLKDWAIYIGMASDGVSHVVQIDGKPIIVSDVRHPQPSKREQIIAILKGLKGAHRPDELADEILKITEGE